MKVKIYRKRIHIVPEGSMDEAYIEDTLGLKKGGDKLEITRLDREDGFLDMLVVDAGSK